MVGLPARPGAGRARSGAATFLHESNTIPGKANRLLACLVDEAFLGFSEAATRLRRGVSRVTGTPVRAEFQRQEPRACRVALDWTRNNPCCWLWAEVRGERDQPVDPRGVAAA